MWLIIGIAIGVIVGVLISGVCCLLVVDCYYVGNLREDRSIPEEPYYFMEIGNGRLERLKRNRFALLRVVRENYMQADSDK